MCGVLGVISEDLFVVSDVLLGLKNLEYRGYDSLGISFLHDYNLRTYKSIGNVNNFYNEHGGNSGIPKLLTKSSIGHTRWATHGNITKNNAHPHVVNGISIVHNGIIENYEEIKHYIYKFNPDTIFSSDTDSEVIAHLINLFLLQNYSVIYAITKAVKMFQGKYSFLLLLENDPRHIYGFCGGNPLVLGRQNNKIIIASDIYCISAFKVDTQIKSMEVANINKGDVVRIDGESYDIFIDSIIQEKEYNFYDVGDTILDSTYDTSFGKEDIFHEIYSQPRTIYNTFCNAKDDIQRLTDLVKKYKEFTIIACGSSYITSFIAQEWFDNHTDVIVHAAISSEIQLKQNYKNKSGLYIFISQSGETADTISALEHIKGDNNHCVAIVNNKYSSLSNIADLTIYTSAGIEKSVAATKTFTSQLVVLQLLLIDVIGKENIIYKNQFNIFTNKHYFSDLFNKSVFSLTRQLQDISDFIKYKHNILFIGKGYGYGLALEGALKMKELTYIHAEAIPSGELKHGALALIDDNIPIIAIAPNNSYFDKVYSSICEVKARNGKVIVITDTIGYKKLHKKVFKCIVLPVMDEFIVPFVYVIILQLLSYYLAKIRNTNIDRPRNLAKSVTVE